MKNITLPILFITLLLASACNSEEENNQVEGQVAGTWNLTAISITSTTTVNGMTTIEERTGVQFNNPQITFSENPNEIQSSGSYVIDVTTTVNGQVSSSTQTENLSDTFVSSTWIKQNDTLIITSNNFPIEYAISVLTTNEMRLQYDFDASDPFVSSDVTGTLVFSK